MTEEQMKRRLYGLYQLDWMMSHGYSLTDLMQSMTRCYEFHDQHITDCYNEVEPDSPYEIADIIPAGMKADIEGIFKSWEFDTDAFNGSCWACFDEFCGAELTDVGYIKGLLDRVPSEEGFRDAYNKWLKDNGSEI